MEILLHPVTKRQLEATRSNLPQSLLLAGKSGVGLYSIALFLAGKEHASTLQPKNAKGEIDSKVGTIGIEAIRELYEQTRTKQTTRRVVVLDNAERMSKGAQAAFLKLLEEPNASTHFILTSHQPSQLLATIRSRVRQLTVQPLTDTQTQEFIARQHGIADKKKVQLQFIAPGLPAEIFRLIADDAYFDTKAKIILDARTLLQADTYQKLRIAYAYRSDRESALLLIDGAMTILNHTLRTKPQQGLVQQLEQFLRAKERITANQSIALNLAQIVL